MYSFLRHAGSIIYKREPIHLTIFLTRRCNSNCPFCFYLQSSTSPSSQTDELSLDELSAVSGSFGDLLWLAFSGGEIFLRNDIVEISRLFYDNNRPCVMLFPTNGLLPDLIRQRTELILSSCPKSIVTVKLSLDGVGDDHDILRSTPGSFEKTIRTYHMLSGLLDRFPNFELGVNTVFCANNQDKMDQIIGFVRSLRYIKTHTISLVRGDLGDPGYKQVDMDRYWRAIGMLETNLKTGSSPVYRFKGAGIKAAQDILQRRFIHRTMEERRSVIPCYAGRLNLVVTENGDVYPCEILKTSLGNIREYGGDIRKVIASDRSRKIIRSIKNRECFCTHECYFMTNILFNPMLYGALLREYRQLK